VYQKTTPATTPVPPRRPNDAAVALAPDDNSDAEEDVHRNPLGLGAPTIMSARMTSTAIVASGPAATTGTEDKRCCRCLGVTVTPPEQSL
jgi:hypothetical protein